MQSEIQKQENTVSSEEIKNVTLAYCVENLQNNPPDDEVKQLVNIKKQLHDYRMEHTDSEGFEVTKDSFNKVLGKFGTKKTKAYNFLLKAGNKFKNSIYKLCKRMLEAEEFPSSFRKTVLNQIWKGKGSSDILKNSRFIHNERLSSQDLRCYGDRNDER